MPEPEVMIRRLEREDAARCRELRLHGLLDSPSAFLTSHAEEFRRSLEEVEARIAPTERHQIIGGFAGDRLVAMLGLRREEHERTMHKAWLVAMYVHPDFRRRGIGRCIVAYALDQARAMEGVRQINLGVNAANHAAHQLYLSMGFRPYGLEQAFMYVDGEPHDEIHMVRFLEGHG